MISLIVGFILGGIAGFGLAWLVSISVLIKNVRKFLDGLKKDGEDLQKERRGVRERFKRYVDT